MKKYLWIVAFFCMVSVGFTQQFSEKGCGSTGLKSATGSAYTVAGNGATLCDVSITTDASTACSILCYDNASAASGTALFSTLNCQNPNSAISTCVWTLNRAIANGIYCTMTTGGTCAYNFGVRAGQ